jgi:alkylhydroperoxidase/carboxymuconolactone decarboxylase family protein YurZ
MADMPPFVTAFEDIEFGAAAARALLTTFAPGALDPKVKLLIALALDIADGFEPGTSTIADMARESGATEPEILETIGVTHTVAGLQRLSIAVNAVRAPAA